MKIYVGGVNGVGKTTVLEALFKETGFPVKHATQEFLKFLGIPGDYNELRKLDDEYRKLQLNQFMSEIAASRKSFILDSHYLIMVDGVIKSVIDEWIKQYDLLIYLTAPAEVILERLNSDNRDRALFSSNDRLQQIHELQLFLDKTKNEVNSTANKYKIPMCILETDQELMVVVNSLKDRLQ